MHQQQQPQTGGQFQQSPFGQGSGGGQFGQQGFGTQQTGQFGQQGGQLSYSVGQSFSQVAPQQITQSVVDLDRLETVAAYAHNRAMQQGNHQVALIADAIEGIAHIQKDLVVMDNPLAQEMSRCVQQVIQSAIPQLQQYTQQPEIQELLSEAQQTTQTVSQSLQQTSGGGGQGTW